MPLPTPFELYRELTTILQEETGCSATWAQHEGPLGISEAAQIFTRIEELSKRLLRDCHNPPAIILALDEGSDAPGIDAT